MQHRKSKRKVMPPPRKTRTIRKWKQGQKNKWLPDVRRIIGKSQVQFAAMIGEEPSTIINIENGRTRLSTALANKIQSATGVYAAAFLNGNNTPLSFGHETVYSRKDFDHWKVIFYENQKNIEKFLDLANDTLFLMLSAAIKSGGPKNLLPALKVSFAHWCNTAVRNFQLMPCLDEILKSERKYIHRLSMSYGDWRHPKNKVQSEFFQFVENKSKANNETLTLTRDCYPCWGACGNMKIPADDILSEPI